MQHTKFIVLATLCVLTFNFANGDERNKHNYKKLRQKATECNADKSRFKHGECNWCSCVMQGVLQCTDKLCPSKRKTTNSVKSNLKGSKEGGRNQNYIKLANKASKCVPGKEIQNRCLQCKCITDGVLKCTRLKDC